MRATAAERMETIRLVEDSDLPVSRTLKELGVARSTFYRWYQAYLDDGEPERAMKVAREGLKLDEKNVLALEVLIRSLRYGREQTNDDRMRKAIDEARLLH